MNNQRYEILVALKQSFSLKYFTKERFVEFYIVQLAKLK